MQRVACLQVPPIYSPIPPAIHPQHAAVDAATTAWAEHHRIGSAELRARLVTHDIGTFAARILPHRQDTEVVSILADFILWLFGVDDGYCEESDIGHRPDELGITLDRLLRVAQIPRAPMLLDDPLANGLRDLRHRMEAAGATGSQIARWVSALREYNEAVIREAALRRANAIPSLDDYTLIRLYSGATTVVLPMLELGHGHALDESERDDERVQAAGEMASFVIAWDNDIFSHHKESRGDGYYLNVLRVLMEHHGLTADEALTRAIAQRDRVLTLFLRLREALLPNASEQLRRYLDSLADFIRGSQDWGITSRRYTTPEDPAALPSVFTSTPTDDRHEPLDIPAVSGWWDLLPGEHALRPVPGDGRSARREWSVRQKSRSA